MKIALIVAAADNGVIGLDNQLPWHQPADLRRFRDITRGHPVIHGRKSYESIGKPLPGRLNIVLTRQLGYAPHPDVLVVGSLSDAFAAAQRQLPPDQTVFVLGGADVYRQVLTHHQPDLLYLTRIHAQPVGDAYFDDPDPAYWQLASLSHHPADDAHAHAMTFLDYERHPAAKPQAARPD
jgi:dihydrofolate reductase